MKRSENCTIVTIPVKFESSSINTFCVPQINEDGGELSKSQCSPINRERKQVLVGGVSPIESPTEDADVKLFLEEALSEINAGEEPDYR